MIGGILAGGASRRMGRPKHTLTLGDGRPMIEHVRDALAAVCDDVVVVGGDEADLADHRPGDGPLAGIETLLSSGRDTNYLVCPCDMPLVTSEMFTALAFKCDAAASAFQVRGESHLRPLPVRVGIAALEEARDHLDTERRVVRHFLNDVGARAIDAPPEWATRLASVNTPAEYEALLAGEG
jgi:molybdopterin-guanine dinucleotide biosynthesis protein A